MGWELHRFPASSFGAVLGTAGQANLWNAMHKLNVSTGPLMTVSGAPTEICAVFWILALIMLIISSLLYAVKMIFRHRSVKWEFSSSIHVNFFFMPLLVILVLGMTAPSPPFSGGHFHLALLYITVVVLLGLEIHLYMEWMYGVSRSLAWSNPTYQLAMVGNIIGSAAASVVGDHAMAVFLFAIGVFYFIIMLTALHTVRDTRAWLGMDTADASKQQQPAAVTVHARNNPAKDRAPVFLTHTGRSSTEPILQGDELAHRHYRAVRVRTSRSNAGTVVFDAQASSPEHCTSPTSVSVSTVDSDFASTPEPQRPSFNESDDDSAILPAVGSMLQDQLDFVSVGEVFSEQFLPHKVNTWSLPAGLQPTLFLYVAPPSLMATSWMLLQGHGLGVGQCDDVCKSFASLGLLFFLFMVFNVPRIVFSSPFSLAFWACTFPSSALAVAMVEFATAADSLFLEGLAISLVALSSLIWVVVAVCTFVVPFRCGLDRLLLPHAVPR